MLRNQTRGQENLSLADFIAPKGDWIGCFAVTAGIGLKELCEKFRAAGDDYNAIMAKLLADRLTEAFAEAVHSFVRRCREAGITVPIIPGIKPLSTVRHLTLLPQTFGCHIPEELGREVLRH